MRFDIWTAVRFFHVGSAILWVGGQLTLSLIVRPAAARLLEDQTRVDLVSDMGSRFARIAGAGLIPLLLATGIALAYHRGVTFGALAVPGYGRTLAVKITLALVSFVVAGLHGMTAVRSSTRAIRIVGMSGAVVSVVVVLLAVSLVP